MDKIFDLDPDLPSIAEIKANEAVDKIIDDQMEIYAPQKNIPSDTDIDDDYRYARENLRDIINSARGAVDDLANIASSSESPRAYEVLSTLMKTMVDANKDLLDIQKKTKDLKKSDQPTNQPQNVTNALFVGSTSDLLKAIKDQTD